MLDILSCTIGEVPMHGNAIPELTRTVVSIFKIVIPVILIILGMLDLGKAVTSNDEKQMKEAQKTLIKRTIYAALIFFITSLVQFVFGSLVPDADKAKENNNAAQCISCFISNSGDC